MQQQREQLPRKTLAVRIEDLVKVSQQMPDPHTYLAVVTKHAIYQDKDKMYFSKEVYRKLCLTYNRQNLLRDKYEYKPIVRKVDTNNKVPASTISTSTSSGCSKCKRNKTNSAIIVPT